MTSRSVSLLCTLSLATLAACGQVKGTESETHIRGGTDSARGNVVLLRMTFGDKSGGCTGTLVAPNAVLTAAHCLDMMKGDGNFLEGESIAVNIPVVRNNVVAEFRTIEAMSYWHTTRDPLMLLGNDFGLVRLKEPVTDVKPAAMASRAPGWGEQMTAVGYGTNNCVLFTRGENFGVQREKSYSWGGPVFVTCPGDSGGPHFNAAGEVSAITSGTRLFGNVNPVVSSHLAGIEQVLAQWRAQ